MNTNELLDTVFGIFEGTASKFRINEEFNINDIENLFEEDRKSFTGYKLIEGFYKRIDELANKKEILLSALESKSKARRDIGNIFVKMSPLSFFSGEEIDGILNSDKIKELHLDSDKEVIASLIHATGNTIKYLTPENMDKFNLDRNSILLLVCKSPNCQTLLTNDVIRRVVSPYGTRRYLVDFLVKNLEDFEGFLTPRNIRTIRLNSDDVTRLIRASGDIEKIFNTRKCKTVWFWTLSSYRFNKRKWKHRKIFNARKYR